MSRLALARARRRVREAGFGSTLTSALTWASAGTPVFNPATLFLTGWWRGSYSASPWVGTASASSSGSNNASEATTPPAAGATVNGFAPVDFDGVDDLLRADGTLDTYFATNAWTVSVLFNADTAAAPGTD